MEENVSPPQKFFLTFPPSLSMKVKKPPLYTGGEGTKLALAH